MRRSVFPFAVFILLTSLSAAAQCDGTPPKAEEYSAQALQKTAYLSTYIQLICDNKTTILKSKGAVDLACKLFLDEDRVVQVSSSNREHVHEYKVRDYFQHLQLLGYTKVEIKWVEVGYVSQLRKGVDGNFYGVITIKQKFTGYKMTFRHTRISPKNTSRWSSNR
ncbi:MAG: hypothetical protein IPL49_22180 [Saprospirales bacterium]|nr:hypothetical protein [Saprospirales bacterium]